MEKEKGFVGMELLVVMAVITALAGLFSHPKVDLKEKSDQTSCYYNMKRIAISIFEYMEKNENYFPPNMLLDSSGKTIKTENGNTYQWLHILGKDGYIEEISPDKSVPEGVFVCPSEKEKGSGVVIDGQQTWWCGTHYGLNGYLCSVSSWPGVFRKKYTDIKSPENVIMLIDRISRVAYPVGKNLCSFRHNNGCNICFADGHIEWVFSEDLSSDIGSPVYGKSSHSPESIAKRKCSVDTVNLSTSDFNFSVSPEYLNAYNLFLKAKTQDKGDYTYKKAGEAFEKVIQTTDSSQVKLLSLYHLLICQFLQMKIQQVSKTSNEVIALAEKIYPGKDEVLKLKKIIPEVKKMEDSSELSSLFEPPFDNIINSLSYLNGSYEGYRNSITDYQEKMKPRVESKLAEAKKKLISGGTKEEKAKAILDDLRNKIKEKDIYAPGELEKFLNENINKCLMESLF